MATKFAFALRRRPVLLVVLALLAAVLGAASGHGPHMLGLWDGPI